MLLEFENKLASFIEGHGLFDSAANVVLAVSGGADSTALLYAMQTLKTENILKTRFVCAHINHQLRGAEADSDEEFVIHEASRLKVNVTTKRVDVREFARDHKLSIETAARQCRMKALMDIAKANHCDVIATAHQKNDNAETVLLRLVRGTGFRGLAGIWPRRDFQDGVTFIRPMLCVTREEVLIYLQARHLKWRTDHTNADYTYRRNFIRHRLLPELQRECKDSMVETLSELAWSARRFYEQVYRRADKVWPDLAECTIESTTLDLKKFQSRSPPIKIELIRRCLIHIGCGQRNLTRRHYERIVQLARRDVTGGTIELPGGFIVQREYENLIFSRNRRFDRKAGFNPPVQLKIPGQVRFDKYLVEALTRVAEHNMFGKFVTNKTNCVERFDLEKVKPPLSVRLRQAGDRFVPLGMDGEKKIGKFLTAQRVPHDVRRNVILVEDREKILWVWPVRISERAKVTADTRQVLELKISDFSGQ